MAAHKDLTSIHHGAYVTDTDPSLDVDNAVTPGKLWIDTTSGPPYPIYKRNDTDDDWDVIGTDPTGDISAAIATHEGALDPHTGYQKESEKNAANGYAGLDSGGLVPESIIDASIARDSEVTSAISAHAGLSDPHAGYQKESEKDSNNGYAGLDSSGLVGTSHLGTGAGITTKFLRGDQTWQTISVGAITIKEVDGSPSVAADTLKLPNGTLTDNMDGSVTYTPTSGSITIQELDGSPLETFTALKFPNGTLTDNGDGTVTYTPVRGVNPMTTAGDIIRGGASGVETRVAIGSAGQLLAARGGTLIPTWEDVYSSIQAVLSGGGFVLSTGSYVDIEVPFDCVITRATLLGDTVYDGTEAVVVNIYKCTYTQFDAGSTHPVVGDKITSSTPLEITTGNHKAQDTTLSSWTTSLSAGDILRFVVDSVTLFKRVTCSLRVKRS